MNLLDETVENSNLMAAGEKMVGEMGADEPRSSGDEYTHVAQLYNVCFPSTLQSLRSPCGRSSWFYRKDVSSLFCLNARRRVTAATRSRQERPLLRVTRMSNQQRLQQHVDQLGPWFHNLSLQGIPTAPRHYLGDFPSNFYRLFANTLPNDLSGWSVLDIGCNAGFYSFEMKRRGAASVLGIDSDEKYLAQARFAATVLHQDVQFKRMSVYDVAELGRRFDLVIFMGVFYHLRHPLLALDLLRRFCVGRLLIFQTLQRGSDEVGDVKDDYEFTDATPFHQPDFPRMQFIEGSYAHDASNWWIPNRAASLAMLRAAGFEIIDHPVSEVYLCRPVGGVAVELPRPFAGETRG